MWIYSENGLSRGRWEDPTNVPNGFVYFDHDPTDNELAEKFSGYTAAAKEKKITALNAEYESQFAELVQAYSTALLAGDTTTAEEVQADYTTLKSEYTAALEAIE